MDKPKFCGSSHVLRLFWIIYVISQTQARENFLKVLSSYNFKICS
ncbi:amino acid ABC transporter permease [Leptospira interrogans]|uniref:Amino acid ABC transporter permease n=2 Tax=Leptospira interrogans TaxID=173 RepID=A0AAQ0AZM6_LEPIR|nr:amino acid ABC transporter permease [Leptospira interrogans]QCO42766.1 amino acid ABC transporter permease [Leptospira interrogans]QOI44557.1 amino acid ABC transporter permease [Leptospira interrogans serovar Canicola]QOI52498.1 amino acid ABC transporter permease [Leptospira interrogans serovar Bataviae]